MQGFGRGSLALSPEADESSTAHMLSFFGARNKLPGMGGLVQQVPSRQMRPHPPETEYLCAFTE